jgi:hypothetical protein
MPHAVAVTGSSASIRLYVARGSRTIASWSVRYGITVEQMPTPSPQSSHVGWCTAGRAAPMPSGVAPIAPMATTRLSLSRAAVRCFEGTLASR